MTSSKPPLTPVYDVAIIGGGISGSLIAYRLSQYDLTVCLIEKECDLAMGATGANSAIVHSGYDPKPGSLKAKYNVEGSLLFEDLCKDLGVPYKKNGSLIIAFNSEEDKKIQALMERGRVNRVTDLEIVAGQEARLLEPVLSPDVSSALYAKTGGIVCPYELTFAASETAAANGVEFLFESEVTSIEREKDTRIFKVHHSNGVIRSKTVINAAGAYADKVSKMAGDDSFSITPRRGEYSIIDRKQGISVRHTIFQTPTSKGKGVLVTPAVDENIIVGPNSVEIEDPDDKATTFEGREYIWEHALKSVPSLKKGDSIRDFAGIRATPSTRDFIIGEHPDIPGFFRAAGIESPGLTAAPAFSVDIADEVVSCSILNREKKVREKENAILRRQAPVKFRELTLKDQENLIKDNPLYANVVCRCEEITQQEILDAIRRTIGEATVNGVKMRTRAGMGRCQGGFCLPRVIDIISSETGIPPERVTLAGNGSYLLTGKTR